MTLRRSSPHSQLQTAAWIRRPAMPGPTAAARTVHPVRGASDGRSSDRGSTDGGSSGDTVSAPDETLAAVQPDSDTSLTPTPDTPVIDDFPVAGPPRGGRTPRPSPDSSGDDAPTGTATGSEGSGFRLRHRRGQQQ